MALLGKLFRRDGLKEWKEPPFWATDALRSPWLEPTTLFPDRERIANNFEAFVAGAYKADGIVFACIATRMLVFSEARLQWRQIRRGQPGDLFGTEELALLENPWPGGTTGELLARMEVVASLAGNFYATVADDEGRLGRAARGQGRRIAYMRPDWTSIVIGSRSGDPRALDAKIVGYVYEPSPLQIGQPNEPVLLLPEEVCHYSPYPDPAARFRGMSWMTPILREIQADKAATLHKKKFFENGATLGVVFRFDPSVTEEQAEWFTKHFNKQHKGIDNAYKALFVGGGVDPTVVGTDLRQLDFKSTQGTGETRMAVAAGVPAAILGISEGLAGSTLNTGNFSAARRRFADGTLRPLWRMAAASLAQLVTAPPGSHLWYDERDIAFLREDEKDAAEIQQIQASTIRQLIDGGFDPDRVVEAVVSGDLRRLQHTGLLSVQLQEPGAQPSANGNGQRQPVGSADAN